MQCVRKKTCRGQTVGCSMMMMMTGNVLRTRRLSSSSSGCCWNNSVVGTSEWWWRREGRERKSERTDIRRKDVDGDQQQERSCQTTQHTPSFSSPYIRTVLYEYCTSLLVCTTLQQRRHEVVLRRPMQEDYVGSSRYVVACPLLLLL